MQHMQEDEFDKLYKSTEPQCNHEVVKLYFNGTHSDYGCIKCGMKSLLLDDFKTKAYS